MKKCISLLGLLGLPLTAAQIDPVVYETEVVDVRTNQERAAAELKLAEAKLCQAEMELARTLKLYEKCGGRSDVEVKQLEVEIAKVEVKVKKAALKRAMSGTP
jgi:hypothetical protein